MSSFSTKNYSVDRRRCENLNFNQDVMKNKKKVSTIILWVARISGTLSLAFLLLFVGAAIVATITGGPDGIRGFNSTSEVILFIFFPVSTIIGLALAWKWEGVGGMITVAGLIGLLIMRSDLTSNFLIVGLILPGIVYIIYWALSRDGKTKAGKKDTPCAHNRSSITT